MGGPFGGGAKNHDMTRHLGIAENSPKGLCNHVKKGESGDACCKHAAGKARERKYDNQTVPDSAGNDLA